MGLTPRQKMYLSFWAKLADRAKVRGGHPFNVSPRKGFFTGKNVGIKSGELNHVILTVGGGRVALSAIIIGEGWQMPDGALLTPEAMRDHLPEILDLSKGTNPTSSDQEGSAFLKPAIESAMAAARC